MGGRVQEVIAAWLLTVRALQARPNYLYTRPQLAAATSERAARAASGDARRGVQSMHGLAGLSHNEKVTHGIIRQVI